MMLIVLYTLMMMVFVLLIRKKKQLSDTFLIIYALTEIIGLAKYFSAFWANRIFETFPQFYFITIPISYSYIPVFYLYFLSGFKQGFILQKKHLLHFMLFLAYLLYYGVRYLTKPVDEVQLLITSRPRFVQFEWMTHEIILNVQFIIYAILLIIAAGNIRRSPAGTKNPPYLLPVLILYLSGILISLIVAIITLFEIKTSFDAAFWTVVYFYIFFIFLFFITVRKMEIRKVKSEVRSQFFDSQKAKELEKFIYHSVLNQKLFLNPDLTMADCAEQLKLDAKAFSFLLNHHLNENFNEYINKFRIEHAKDLLIQQRGRNVQEIMYDSGFNSKAVFYAVFKKHTHLSPGDFRKSKS